nr:uncharacterized protein LOC114924245 [Arachis hypogaea]
MIDQHNPIAQSFRRVREFHENHPSEVFSLKLFSQKERDRGVYNYSSCDEVAALVVGDFDSSDTGRDVIVKSTAGQLQRIYEIHALYWPLQYPLLFSYGKMVINWFVVDSFSMIESQRLYEIKKKRAQLEEKSYKVLKKLCDAMILKHHQLVLESMSYPCNPNWPEFQRYTNRDQVSIADRPDIACRVFHAKMKCLLNDLKNGVFLVLLMQTFFYYLGMYTIEFQKRGLPYLHILLWLDGRNRLQNIEIVDELIYAELPNPMKFPHLYSVVSKYMIHGPYGRMVILFTSVEKISVTVKSHGVDLDNRFVVPYNLLLLMKYQTHINLEFCNKSNIIKYLFKYINKGPDPHVVFDDHDTIGSVLIRNRDLMTMFIAWMMANRTYVEGRTLTYVEFSSKFVYDLQSRQWKPRRRGFSIGRLSFVHPSTGRPVLFWNQTWKYLSDDIIYYRRSELHFPGITMTDEELQTFCQIEIEKLLQANRRSLRDFAGMQLPNVNLVSQFSNSIVLRELEYDISVMLEGHDSNFPKLNEEQKLLSAKLRSQRRIAINVSSSGIASLLLPGGKTTHSMFGIPIELNEDTICRIPKDSPKADLIRLAELIIWDEAPMTNKLAFEALDRSFRDIMTSISVSYKDLPFGGKIIVLDKAILAPTVEIIEEINDHIVQLLPRTEKEYLSADSICGSDAYCDVDVDWINAKFLNQIKYLGLSNHSLKLKKGVPIILLRNIDPAGGLCNGTRFIVSDLGTNVIGAEIVSRSHIGDKVFIPRMNLIPSDTGIPFKFQRRQFSINLCFVMTINKSQGQTLSSVGLFLRRLVFFHGQLYVAISRVKSKDGLRILVSGEKNDDSTLTHNIVFKEIFDKIL